MCSFVRLVHSQHFKVLKLLSVRVSVCVCNLLESDGKCHFETDPKFRYLKFPIGSWKRSIACTTDGVWSFFTKLFDFLQEELGAGNNVLIHCLAGAHRAGTAGVASLMYLCHMDRCMRTLNEYYCYVWVSLSLRIFPLIV
jgi:hypothetical protein